MNKEHTSSLNTTYGATNGAGVSAMENTREHVQQACSATQAATGEHASGERLAAAARDGAAARVRLRDCRQSVTCGPTRRLYAREAARYCSRSTRRDRRATPRALVARVRDETRAAARRSVRLCGGPWDGKYALLADASGTLPLRVRVRGVLYRGRYVRDVRDGFALVRLRWQPRE